VRGAGAPRLWAGWALPAGETPAGAFEAQVRAHEAEAARLLAKGRPVAACAECAAGLEGCRRLVALLADGTLDALLPEPGDAAPPRTRAAEAQARLRAVRARAEAALGGGEGHTADVRRSVPLDYELREAVASVSPARPCGRRRCRRCRCPLGALLGALRARGGGAWGGRPLTRGRGRGRCGRSLASCSARGTRSWRSRRPPSRWVSLEPFSWRHCWGCGAGWAERGGRRGRRRRWRRR